MTTDRLLLCTDLDRTLLPNGEAPESPLARPVFRRLALDDKVSLVYVTGRHLELVLDACAAFKLPFPDILIGDVGTTIYRQQDGVFSPWSHWEQEIAPDWCGYEHLALMQLFDDLDGLTLQDPSRQNRYKLSYTHDPVLDRAAMARAMEQRLDQHGIRASLIWSHDEVAGEGLLDVLPRSATKLHALEFLRAELGYEVGETVFAGDSGNDLDVLASRLPAILVANAMQDVREKALALTAQNDTKQALYLATGTAIEGFNGNYAAGIIEGVVHYQPQWKELVS